MATTTQPLETANKIIESLNEAIRTLDSAERWGNEDLSSITPFLTIIRGTVNDTKYRLAQITLHSAEDQLHDLVATLSSYSLPDELAEHLKNASLPAEIKSKSFFETSLTHDEYQALKNQINVVIGYINDFINYVA